jgi:hypothetical protein
MSSPLPLPDASGNLLLSLIDDAALLDPSGSSLDEAVAGYRAARAHSTSSLLGSFLCPASRLIELSGVLTDTMTASEAPWLITSVLDGDIGAAVTAEHAFSATMEPAARIGLGVRPTWLGAADHGRADATAFTVPRAPLVDVAAGPARDPVVAARFLAECERSGVPCVAWGFDDVVRIADRPGALNMVTAAAFAADHAPEATIVAILEETDPATFHLGRAGVTWRRRTIGGSALRRVRASVLRSVATSQPGPVLADMSALRSADIRRNQ